MSSYQWPPGLSAGSGVSSLNGETGALTLVAGTGITITPSGTNITIATNSSDITYPLLAPNGTVAAPSYSFTNSTTTGIYSPGVNQLNLAVNGVAALAFSTAQVATFSSTVASPFLNTNLLNVTGGADVVTAFVKGNSPQTANIFEVRKFDGTILFDVTPAGAGAFLSTLSTSELDTPFVNTNLLNVTGGADVVTAFIKGNGTQTADILEVKKFDGTVYFKVAGTGAVTSSVSTASPIFQTSSSSPADAGVLRLAFGDKIEFRNQTDNGNHIFGIGSNDAFQMDASLSVGNNSVSAATLSAAGTVSGAVNIQGGGTVTTYSLILPSAQGAANSYLKNDGSGNLSFATITSISGNAATATALQTARTINGISFDGTANITVTAAAGTLTGATLNSTVTASSLTSVGTLANLTVTNPITGSVTGSAATLTTPRNINTVAFDGSANITVTAAAGTLTGATLNSTVTASSLTSVGTLTALTVTGSGTSTFTGIDLNVIKSQSGTSSIELDNLNAAGNAALVLVAGDASTSTKYAYIQTRNRGSANQNWFFGNLGSDLFGWASGAATNSHIADLSNAGQFSLNVAGGGLSVKEGSNAKQGTATLVLGASVVSNTSVTASSRIFLTVQSLGTVSVPTAVAVTARTAGTSFTITSANATDTSVVAYEIFEPS